MCALEIAFPRAAATSAGRGESEAAAPAVARDDDDDGGAEEHKGGDAPSGTGAQEQRAAAAVTVAVAPTADADDEAAALLALICGGAPASDPHVMEVQEGRGSRLRRRARVMLVEDDAFVIAVACGECPRRVYRVPYG